MIVESWTIASKHIARRWWWVRVHDTPHSLQEASYRHKPYEGRDFWGAETVGCCQPVRGVLEVGDDPDAPIGPLLWPANGLAGVIRLCSDHLYAEVIYHELLHAACSTYRMNREIHLDLGTGYESMQNEEDLAYIYGQLAADMDAALRKRTDPTR